METENVLNVVWSIVNSPVGITVIASIVLWLLNKVYAAKPLWQQYEGVIISGIKFAEKNIPDDYPEKSVARMDEALKYVLKIYEGVLERRATAKERAELESGIGIVHAELEVAGGLHQTAENPTSVEGPELEG